MLATGADAAELSRLQGVVDAAVVVSKARLHELVPAVQRAQSRRLLRIGAKAVAPAGKARTRT